MDFGEWRQMEASTAHDECVDQRNHFERAQQQHEEEEVDEVGDEHRRKVIWKLLKE